MLRIVPTSSAAQAKSYYSHSDYYTEDQELPGLWRGKGADRLGLAGTVEKAQFDALCDNRHPVTGEPITAHTKSNRTVGYDFNFHAPKSLSLLHAFTGDTKILQAFQESVDETMRLIEADMQTRVRKGKIYQDRTTGEMVWARFDHFTARPIDGVPDPHLHSHCFGMNMTFDAEEEQWKAGQFRSLKRDAPFYQSVFHSKLTSRLRDLGVPLEKTRDGWEVQGISRATLEKFSRRTKQIEEIAAQKGIVDAEEKAELGAKTRQGKAKNLSMGELRQAWADRLDPAERKSFTTVRTGRRTLPDAGLEVRQALDYACRHLFERQSVVAERQLAGEMLQAGLGKFSLDDAIKAIRHSDVIVKEVNGQRLATTREVLAEEEKLIAFARDGRGCCTPLGPADYKLTRDWFNSGQAAAIKHVISSSDRVMLIRGAAGAGKTSLMQEAVGAIEQGGKKVFTFAPSAAASRGVLRSEGFATADTVARLLVDAELQESTHGQVLWIDEAGLLGSKQMRQVFDLAERLDCRVILSGDRRQHGSVERGAVLRILEEQAGLQVAEVKEIQRQKGEYKEAIKLLADGRTDEGFAKLDDLGWVKEVSNADRYQQLAADYVASVKAGQSALVVSPTHAEGAKVTETIRAALREDGRIDGSDHEMTTFTRVDLTEAERGKAGNYRPGDLLQFHQNAKGFKLGDRLIVKEGQSPPTDQAARFQVYRPTTLKLAKGDAIRITKAGKTRDGHKLENGSLYSVAGFTKQGDVRLNNGWIVGRDYGHFTHGYVATSHASQGKTVDRVLIGQSSQSWPASSREQFYVSASRGRQSVTVYTDDKEALREAIQRSDTRLAATELVGRENRSDKSRLRQQRLVRAAAKRPTRSRILWQPPRRDTREMPYDR